MMYSIIPSEMIFAQEDTIEIKEAQVDGVTVLARNCAQGGYQVERILSTDPADYLKSGILGRKISME